MVFFHLSKYKVLKKLPLSSYLLESCSIESIELSLSQQEEEDISTQELFAKKSFFLILIKP